MQLSVLFPCKVSYGTLGRWNVCSSDRPLHRLRQSGEKVANNAFTKCAKYLIFYAVFFVQKSYFSSERPNCWNFTFHVSITSVYHSITSESWKVTLLLAEALARHSTHSLALLNCHNFPRGERYSSQNKERKKEYSERRRCCTLCLSFNRLPKIHYSWLSVGEEPGFLLPFKSNLNIHSSKILLLITRSPAHASTLTSVFPNLSMCVFRLRLLFIQSDETSRPDGRWIIMSFIFKWTALSSQWPNQFKYFTKLDSSHRSKLEYSHYLYSFF